MSTAALLTVDENGNAFFDQDDHGESRRTRHRRRVRARAIAYHDDPERQSDSISPLRRITTCGLPIGALVTIRRHLGRCFAAGLRACGSIWTCPTCAARIRARRELEIEGALATHVAGGGTIGMMTLTMQHNATMSLASTVAGLNHAWQRLQQRRGYQPLYMALTGTITTMEITTGSGNAGWHPHLHILLLAGPDTTYEQVDKALAGLRRTWSELVNAKTTPYSLEHGLNLTWFGKDSAAAAKYVTKLAKEITLNDTKSGNDPFSLLDVTGDVDVDNRNAQMFLEYAHATRGRRAHRWSRGLRAALALEPELSDEELADENELLGEEVLIIEAAYWTSIDDMERLAWIEFCEAQHIFSSA